MANVERVGLVQEGYSAIENIGKKVLKIWREVSLFARFLGEIVRQAIRGPMRRELIFQHLEFIGNQSLNIILMTSFFTGAVFGLQIGGIFQIFKAEGLMGAATGKALARELSPMMTAFLLTGRAGSAITAEIATMKVNEQVDAMEAMAVDPISYLVVPRVIAATIILPFLTGIFSFIGVVGAFITGVILFDIDEGVFIEKMTWFVGTKDIWSGLVKSVVFANVIVAMACHYGLRASGGAKGVGVATTDSVVMTLLALLSVDFLITYLQIAL